MTRSGEIKLLAISGSIRKGSFNTAFVRALGARIEAAGKASFTLFPLDDIPVYNQDVEQAGLPEAVHAFKEAIAAADGVVVSTPEYNNGMSGVLKNALDWASRPAHNSVLKDKPCLPMSTSAAAGGGVRAHTQMRETLFSCLSRVVTRRDVAVPGVFMKVKDGQFIDEDSLAFAEEAVDELIKEIELVWR